MTYDQPLAEWIADQKARDHENAGESGHSRGPRKRTPEEHKAFIEWIVHELFPTEVAESEVCIACTRRRPAIVYQSDMCIYPLCADCLNASTDPIVRSHHDRLVLGHKLSQTTLR